MKPTLWITGVAGFTGRHLVAAAADQLDGPRIVGLDLAESPATGVDVYHRVDLIDVDAVAALARENPPRWVIHLAGAIPPASAQEMWYVNVGTTVSLLRGLACAGCRKVRVVTIGSAAEYLAESPGALTETSPCGGSSPYGRAKWAQTLLALSIGRELGLATMVARPFNLIGPGLPTSLVAGWLCHQFAKIGPDEDIRIGNIKSARDFVDVRDAVRAYCQTAARGEPGEIYNVCSGTATTVEQLIAMLGKLTGKSPRICVDSARLRDADPPVNYGDSSKLQQATGWQPRTSLTDSLAAMLQEAT